MILGSCLHLKLILDYINSVLGSYSTIDYNLANETFKENINVYRVIKRNPTQPYILKFVYI